MARIAVVLDDFFEDVEYTDPVKTLQKAGHECVVVGLKTGRVVKGKKVGTEITIEKSFEEVTPGDFDALLIPGGYSPDRLRAHPQAVTFVTAFMDNPKPVFAICHGPQLLITADRLNGRQATGYRSLVQDLKNAGARYEDRETVVDGNLLTSREPGDLPAFDAKMLEILAGEK